MGGERKQFQETILRLQNEEKKRWKEKKEIVGFLNGVKKKKRIRKSWDEREIQRVEDKTRMKKFKVRARIKRKGKKKKGGGEENYKTRVMLKIKTKELEEIEWIEDKVRVKKEEEVERVKRKR